MPDCLQLVIILEPDENDRKALCGEREPFRYGRRKGKEGGMLTPNPNQSLTVPYA